MSDAGLPQPYRQNDWTDAVAMRAPTIGCMCVALYLASRASHDSGLVPHWVDAARITSGTTIQKSAVHAAIAWLGEAGLIGGVACAWTLLMPTAESAGTDSSPRRRTRIKSAGTDSSPPGRTPVRRDGLRRDGAKSAGTDSAVRRDGLPPAPPCILPANPRLPASPACLPAGACPPASAHAAAHEKTPEPMLATEPGMDGAASHPPASAPPAPGVMEYSDAPDDSARIDALAARIAEALFVAYNDGVSAESAGSFVGVGRVADAIPAARWLIANVGALPDLPRGATEAQIVAVASAAGEAWGRWLQRPSDKPKGNRPPVPRPAPRPLRWLCAPAQDFATLRAQLDRHRERAQRPNNGVRVTTTPNGEITMATETTEKRAAALIRHFAEHPAPPEHQEGRAQRAEVTAYLIDHPTSPLVERWQRVLAQWAQWEQA